MIIVDTSVWIDYFRGIETAQATWLDTQLDHQRLAITDLILCEILQGISSEKEYRETRDAMFQFEILSTGGTELALAAADNYRVLRKKGITIRKTIDCLIASFCLLNDHSLLHNDSDYDGFENELGLNIIHP